MPYITVARLLLALTPILPCAALAMESSISAETGLTISAALDIPAKPITTRAQLDTYQHATPPTSSPLSWLTPGGQRRFLDSLIFDEHGVVGMDLGDLRYELTREQAYTLLRLFGEESYALDLDARNTPRPASGDDGMLESPYERLIAVPRQHDDQAQQAQAITRIYADDFAPLQVDAQRHKLGDRDVEFLFRAATIALHATNQPDYLADMRGDFAELERRHRVERPHANDMYAALATAGHAEEARALLASNPLIDRSPAPVMRSPTRISQGQPSLWIVTPGTRKRELVRFRFNIRVPAQVVVVASTGCHFSENAARDIEADPLLRNLFRDYGQWVTPIGEVTAFDAVQGWNRAYPEMRLGIAYDNAALPMVQRIETPTFYFLDHGVVVDKVAGWPASGNLEAIRRGLRKIDLLR